VPQRGAFTRGIFATAYFDWLDSLAAIQQLYGDYYAGHPFIRISEQEIDLKQVVNTNRCFLHLQQHGNRVVVTSIIDNLLKGAAGQAVQNMNLLFGLDETTGLHLKPSAF
jgi:N-acetyl-gamma-glutamyl-phosphate reductase